MTATTALLAAAAALLAVPGLPRVATRRTWRGRAVAVGTVALALLCWLFVDRPRLVVLAVIAAAAVLAVGRLTVRVRRDRDGAALRRRVVELCEGLEAELAAGQPAAAALARATAGWPELAVAGRVAVTGGDVPAVLRRLAGAPGAADLRVVAAAWQVAHRTGLGLADALERVGRELREAEQTRRIVAGELASARATARLVAALPLVALAMGGGAGADPWSFLLAHPLGLACLAGGLGCGVAGLAWIEALARDVEGGR